MNLYSKDFLKDVKGIPLKKKLYVYVWKGTSITEYLAEFRVYEHEFKNLEACQANPTGRVQILQNLSYEENFKVTKSFTIDVESGEVNSSKLWLPERNFALAKQLFIEDRKKRIKDLEERIVTYQNDIETLLKI